MATPLSVLFILLLVASSTLLLTVSANFYNDVDITWGDGRAKILDNGQQLQMTLDQTSGCGFQSKNEYLFAKIDLQIKLVPGNSAGTVTAYYLSSQGPKHDEIDFEFLGNLSGDPYVLHTNVFAQGLGNREQRFYLWFDPTTDFHTYSVLWTSNQIIFSVDGTPVRVFKNREKELSGVDNNYHYPKSQAMRLYSSLWDAEDWATRGGLVKTDWTKAPFVASFRNFNAATSSSSKLAAEEVLDSNKEQKLQWVRNNYMIYDYCADTKRFPQGLPSECK